MSRRGLWTDLRSNAQPGSSRCFNCPRPCEPVARLGLLASTVFFRMSATFTKSRSAIWLRCNLWGAGDDRQSHLGQKRAAHHEVRLIAPWAPRLWPSTASAMRGLFPSSIRSSACASGPEGGAQVLPTLPTRCCAIGREGAFGGQRAVCRKANAAFRAGRNRVLTGWTKRRAFC